MKKTISVLLTFALILSIIMMWNTVVYAAATADLNSPAYNSLNIYSKPQCTWYVWGRAKEVTGTSLPNLGNAKDWYANAAKAGYSVGSIPKANSIAVWYDVGASAIALSSGLGHVTYVESVNGNTMNITEGNFLGTPYHEATLSTNGVRSPGVWQQNVTGYIYLDNNGGTPASVLNSIAITTPATKLSYTVGDALDITGLAVTGTYSDGSTKAEGITVANVTGFNSAAAATDQVLTITVGGKTTTYKVQIVAIVNPDYTYTVTAGQAQIAKYTGAGGVVTIPSTLGGVPVTSIGEGAFESCTGLTSISLPQSVTSIGGLAFASCTGLTTISIPQGVTSIGDWAFEGCYGLTSISLPQGVTSIGDFAFASCTGLTTISIPQGVTSIGAQAFEDCRGLTSITVDANNLNYTSIDGVLFNKAGTILIACPEGLTTIKIPQTVTSIGDYAFWNCNKLTTIDLPQGITSIGKEAFFCNGLTSINIPQGVTSIGDNAFGESCNLTSITVTVDNSNYVGIDGVLFNKAGTSLIACPGGLTNISIPQGVISIGGYAFSGCEGLTSISIPQGVTSIGNQAFWDCIGLTSIAFNSATTTIYDSADTIPATAKIIGYDPSTAKEYATKYNRTFEVIGTAVDKTALTSTVSNAKTLIGSKTVGTSVGNIPQAAHDAFQAVINAATTVQNNASATQPQVDEAVTTLATATTTFNNAIVSSNTLPAQQNISLNKEWRITFSQPIGSNQGIIDSNILLWRIDPLTQTKIKVDITPVIDPTSSKVVIVKHSTPFVAGASYELSVNVGIKDVSGKALSNSVGLSFMTQAP